MESVSTHAPSRVTSTSATPVSVVRITTLDPPQVAQANQSTPRSRTPLSPCASSAARISPSFVSSSAIAAPLPWPRPDASACTAAPPAGTIVASEPSSRPLARTRAAHRGTAPRPLRPGGAAALYLGQRSVRPLPRARASVPQGAVLPIGLHSLHRPRRAVRPAPRRPARPPAPHSALRRRRSPGRHLSGGAPRGRSMSPEELARIIDHTLLKPEATPAQIEQLCVEAVQYRFYAVCVNPCWVTTAAAALRGHAPRVCSVVGFPLGANRSDLKAAEADAAVHDGASEIDMVLNLGHLCGGDFRAVWRALASSIVLKVIVEAAALPEVLKREAAQLAVVAGADFVKTSIGLHPAGGATV